MSKERPQPQPEGFQFTEHEKLYDRISHERFQAIIDDDGTTVHSIELTTNNYGEFLFVTTSRGSGEGRSRITFWGAGYHEYRERWFTDEWRWYNAHPNKERDERSLNEAEVTQILRERLQEITPQAQQSVQSKRGELFEMLADFADDDGVIAEMEDMEHLLGDLDDL